MKPIKLVLLVLFLAGVTGIAMGQDTLYYDYFTDGSMNLDWFTPWEGGDNMEVDYMPGNPSGDDWVGLIRNGQSGGGVGTTLEGELAMTDYQIEAYVYVTVNSSTYHGICARWDTTGGNRYYYLRTDFDSDQRLQLRKFPGQMGMGEDILVWTGAQIPGGVPTADGWHHMALKCEGDQLWAYWDDQLLSGCPVTDSYCTNGFFGLYVFNFMNPDVETICDDIIVTGEAGPMPFDLVPNDNTILDDQNQPLGMRPYEGQQIKFQLDWTALGGSATSPPFDVVMNLDDSEFYRTTINGVEPNSTHETISTTYSAAIGNHTIEWVLDDGNTVSESNETNNTLEEDFLVLEEGAFDFQADSAWIGDNDLVLYEENPEAGDPVKFILWWSVPMGDGFSPAFNIAMDLIEVGVDTTELYTELIPTASSGENYETVTDAWTAEEGFFVFQWFIDVDGWVDEFIENNNFIMNAVTVDPPTHVGWGDPGQFLPDKTQFIGVYPTPFNESVKLAYNVAANGSVKISIYDINGRETAVLYDGFAVNGPAEIVWNAKDFASGTYFAVLTDGITQSVQKLMYIK